MRVAGVVGIAVLGFAVIASARPGKVVRVERQHGGKKLDIAVCEARSSRVSCYGPVESGDQLHGLDEKGGYRLLEVQGVRPHPEDSCKTGVPVMVTAREIRTGRSSRDRNQLALRGVEVRPGVSRMLDKSTIKPAPRPGEQVLLAVDLSGDGVAEIAATMRGCNDVRARTPGVSGKNGHSFCITFWRRASRVRPWKPVNRVDLHMCQ